MFVNQKISTLKICMYLHPLEYKIIQWFSYRWPTKGKVSRKEKISSSGVTYVLKALFNSLCYLIWWYLFWDFLCVWRSFSKNKRSQWQQKKIVFKKRKYFLSCYIYFHLKIVEADFRHCGRTWMWPSNLLSRKLIT